MPNLLLTLNSEYFCKNNQEQHRINASISLYYKNSSVLKIRNIAAWSSQQCNLGKTWKSTIIITSVFEVKNIFYFIYRIICDVD